jgi:hypothetical protein
MHSREASRESKAVTKFDQFSTARKSPNSSQLGCSCGMSIADRSAAGPATTPLGCKPAKSTGASQDDPDPFFATWLHEPRTICGSSIANCDSALAPGTRAASTSANLQAARRFLSASLILVWRRFTYSGTCLEWGAHFEGAFSSSSSRLASTLATSPAYLLGFSWASIRTRLNASR